MREDKVPDGICSLDWVRVAVERVKKPGVFGTDKVARLGIRPETVLVVGVKVYTGLLCFAPMARNAAILIGLMYYLGDELRSSVN